MQSINLKNPIHCLAVGFGSGLLKPAPGTWGSLLALILAILCWQLTACQALFFLLSLAGFAAGIVICGKTSLDLGVHDDGRIVWDEIVAVWLMFAFLPEYSWVYYALVFVTFRFFDILKPYPIRYFDRYLQGGFGIMFDDILAALYALLTIYLIYWSF